MKEGRRWQAGAGACGLRGCSLAATAIALGRGEEDDRRGARWAGPHRWAAGTGAGPVAASGKFLLFFKFFVLFYFYLIFCHCFEFKK